MRPSYVVAAAIALLAAAPTAAQAKTVTVGAKASGHTVHLRRGDVLRLRLPENPSTGYAWRLTRRPDHDVLRSGGSRFVDAPSTKRAGEVVGVPGARVFRWRAVGTGRARIGARLFPPGRATRAARIVRVFVAVRR